MAQDSTPLTDADYKTIVASLKDLDTADEQIRKAKRAGIDTGDAEATSAKQRDQLLKLKNTYFPGKI